MPIARFITAARRVPRTELAAVGLALCVGVTLMGVKFLAYALTGSAAVFTDAAGEHRQRRRRRVRGVRV